MSWGRVRAGAGRPRGSKNRRTLEVEARLEALGCDPIEEMARTAMNPEVDLALRA